MNRTFTARWIFPVSGPPLEGGTITIRGEHIESVQTRGNRTADDDLGNVAIVPGFVNAHTHLDLTGARGRIPPTDPEHFTDWLRGVIAFRRARTPEQVQADIRAGIAECLRHGTTFIGDISSEGASWNALHESKTRSFLFWEVLGLGESAFVSALSRCRDKAAPLEAKEYRFPGVDFCWGASPHAPYSANHAESAALLIGMPGTRAIHLAESPAEMELLATRSGPFVSFLQELGVWSPEAITLKAADFVRQPGSSRTPPPRLFVHCNYLPPDTPFDSNQSVVYCPRTHAAFGHPPHPFREFLRRGVRVCLATDSLASNPDLDIFAEAPFVHEQHPDLPGEVVLKMITLWGAEAIGWGKTCGSLEPGKVADFVAIPLPNGHSDDPHELLFAGEPGIRRTLFQGTWRE